MEIIDEKNNEGLTSIRDAFSDTDWLSCKAEITALKGHSYESLKNLSTYQFQSEDEILDLVKSFEEQTLPLEDWTHLAHLVVASYYIKTYSLLEAQARLRTYIKMYNESVGIKNSLTSGYHETVTIFWTRIIDKFVQTKNLSLLEICNLFSFYLPQLKKEFILGFYSKALLSSPTARIEWVAPDLGDSSILYRVQK